MSAVIFAALMTSIYGGSWLLAPYLQEAMTATQGTHPWKRVFQRAWFTLAIATGLLVVLETATKAVGK